MVPGRDGHQALRWMLGRKAEFPCGLTEGMAEALCCRLVVWRCFAVGWWCGGVVLLV